MLRWNMSDRSLEQRDEIGPIHDDNRFAEVTMFKCQQSQREKVVARMPTLRSFAITFC